MKKEELWSIVKEFLLNKSNKDKIIVIYGPTASGKTSRAIDIAKILDTEVISTDSRQIFRYMDIGTAKITPQEMNWIRHHMIDIVDPSIDYSVWEFQKESQQIIQNLKKNEKIPVLAWGTGLYIDSIIYDFNIPRVSANLTIRSKYEKIAEKNWSKAVYQELVKLDPEYAKELDPNNTRYIIRAIEVKLITGKSKKDFREDKKLKYDTLFLTPYNWDRKKLYDKINLRVEMMFELGLLEEVKKILNMWYNRECFGMKTIWYTEVLDYLEWKLSLEECKDLIKKNTRNYAKRQLTWFRRYEK